MSSLVSVGFFFFNGKLPIVNFKLEVGYLHILFLVFALDAIEVLGII